jgi:hypothetical protein
MPEPTRRRPERNAGAFLAPDMTLPVPMRTLSDEYEDRPAEPEEEAEPGPEPERPGLLERILERLTGLRRDG